MAKMSMILAKVARARYRQFDNVDDAICFLEEVDKSVDWTIADMSLLVNIQNKKK